MKQTLVVVFVGMGMLLAGCSSKSGSNELGPESFICTIDSDCVLVQDALCRIVSAVNTDSLDAWDAMNQENLKLAEDQPFRCPEFEPEYTDISNFTVRCSLT